MLATFRRHAWALPLLGWVFLLMLPALGTSLFTLRQVLLIAIYALVVAGLNLSFGFAGELALGQVAIMAAGAYTTAILGSRGVHDLSLTLLAAVVVAALLGLLTGVPSIRLSAWALGLTSFFLVLLIPGLVVATRDISGGPEGIAVLSPTLFGAPIDTPAKLYLVAIVLLGVWMVIFRNLILSRYGRALAAYRESPLLVESLGVGARRLKLSAYVVGSIPAGVAGCLYAHMSGYISPTPFNLALVVAMIAAAVFAGASSIYGAVFGAALLVLGPLQAQEFEIYSTMIYGLFLLAVGALFGDGIAGLIKRRGGPLARLIAAPLPAFAAAGPRERTAMAMHGGTLRAEGVSKSFGGNRALNEAGLVAEPGSITGIIGSNGAGKTTLLNAVSGFVKPDEGSVHLDGESIFARAPHAIAKAGVARAFQTPLIPADMSVLDVVRTGSLRTESFGVLSAIGRLPRHHRRERRETEHAMELLRYAELDHVASENAASLPLGQRRLVEVVRALAGDSKVILLDEPAAGLDDVALGSLEVLLRRLASSGATVVLIEHNVPFIFGLADKVFVMELGATIAEGTPDEVRSDPRVISSYLGRRAAPDLVEEERTHD